MRFTAFVAPLALLLASCASVPMAPPQLDLEAKKFEVDSGNAGLYIYRNELLGGAIPLTVSVNDKVLGQTGPNTYFYLNLKPGKYKVASYAETVSTLELQLDPGTKHYVWQEIKMGVSSARSMLQEVDEATGQEGVLDSNRIASVVEASEILPLGSGSSAATETENSTAAKLRELQGLLEDGVITQQDFDEQKARILQQM